MRVRAKPEAGRPCPSDRQYSGSVLRKVADVANWSSSNQGSQLNTLSQNFFQNYTRQLIGSSQFSSLNYNTSSSTLSILWICNRPKPFLDRRGVFKETPMKSYLSKCQTQAVGGQTYCFWPQAITGTWFRKATICTQTSWGNMASMASLHASNESEKTYTLISRNSESHPNYRVYSAAGMFDTSGQ